MIRNCGRPRCEMLTSGHCPLCDGPLPTPAVIMPQMGCICPPTSEQTCGNPMYPRKAFHPIGSAQ